MENKDTLRLELKSSAIWTALVTLLFLLFYAAKNPITDIIIALPFFIVFYYIFFSIGKVAVSAKIRSWIQQDLKNLIVLPLILITLYVIYIFINGQNPLKGALALVPYLIIFPVLVFAARRRNVQKIDWIDFTAFVIYLLPTAFIEVKPAGELPFNGDGFDSIYRIILIVSAVYSFGVVRGLNDIGFFPSFNVKSLWTSIWVWFVFYLFVLIIGFNVNFIKYVGHEIKDLALLNKIAITLIATFFHTAIFEELFFRGILLNLLTKRIGQAKSWLIFWVSGLIISIPLALLVGYTLKGGMQWFPALMTILIFTAAFFIERTKKSDSGVYTGLAITSVIFGLVHYHSHAIIYIGFACIAGWAYGYTYLKTKNVFYSAIVHTLVNSSVLIFGFEFIK
jgi:hypothetical protein